jgi:hypothetical protein
MAVSSPFAWAVRGSGASVAAAVTAAVVAATVSMFQLPVFVQFPDPDGVVCGGLRPCMFSYHTFTAVYHPFT